MLSLKNIKYKMNNDMICVKYNSINLTVRLLDMIDDKFQNSYKSTLINYFFLFE